MKKIYVRAVPFDKNFVTLALESGVDGIIVDKKDVDQVASLGRTDIITSDEMVSVKLKTKGDEKIAADALKQGGLVALEPGWEIIPVENLLAQGQGLGVVVESAERAEVAVGILEKGVDFIIVPPEVAGDLKKIVSSIKLTLGSIGLTKAKVKEIKTTGLGHRVCVDTLSVLQKGQGMLVGNSSAFTFLVNAETESNPYVAARPFRVNAGAVHAYAVMPGDKTNYLEELSSGSEVLIVDAQGNTSPATVGRIKVEIRPMLLITAETAEGISGSVFLQNAETIRLVGSDGTPISVVSLKPGDEIFVRTDTAGRHFGMRIEESIKEG